ncbi:hypothetical protein GUJ93_ZPchr0008g12447 [Zizania palustris]|uniref:KIB1-4 beta-propeller domain-containing protein n=1 Tax=Zizania palustris TaxID=103762 RepID=A0A8J5RVZ0_ZIZPA|nr:hypothetical protein GUJ93_ZPchr0008g12447 [Zizania palustris]
MAADPQWADLHAGLISRIADCCMLPDYVSCRAVCSAWRAAILPLPSRPLTSVCGDGVEAAGGQPEPLSLGVCSNHAQRWTRLLGVPQPPRFRNATRYRCVGARDGWVALAAATANGRRAGRTIVSLFNPLTGTEIPLHASLFDPKCESAAKIVFSPDPTPRNFAAVSMCRPNRLVVHRSTGGRSSRLTLDTDALMDDADLVDVAYSEDDKVYCLTTNGDVYVLHLNRRRHHSKLGPIEVEPLVVTGTDVFSTPYETISQLTDTKNLVLCNGTLYQVWRRPSGAGSALAAIGSGADSALTAVGSKAKKSELRKTKQGARGRGAGHRRAGAGGAGGVGEAAGAAGRWRGGGGGGEVAGRRRRRGGGGPAAGSAGGRERACGSRGAPAAD